MSMPNETTITCPSCDNEQKFTIWNSVNVSLDPDLKQKIISGELIEFCCDKCGDKSRLVYPMLYHDMNENIMIWLIPGDNPPEDNSCRKLNNLKGMDEGYQYRWVQSYNELLDKIHVFDAGIDDRELECYKAILHEDCFDDLIFSDEILFVGCTDDEKGKGIRFGIVSKSGYREGTVDMEDFERLRKATGDDINGIFPLDDDWSRVNYHDLLKQGDSSDEEK